MRVLLVGGGCRGLDLTRRLVADGHAVRLVTRDAERRAEVEAAGAECWIGTPDVIGTLRYGLENVTLLLWLLGTAEGDAEKVSALHGSRLRMMLEKTTDTTVRGVIYEAAGTLPDGVLDQGRVTPAGAGHGSINAGVTLTNAVLNVVSSIVLAWQRLPDSRRGGRAMAIRWICREAIAAR